MLVNGVKVESERMYIITDCYGDVYHTDNLQKFVTEWYGGEISLAEGMVKIFEDCEILKFEHYV